jgi:hypothetical protein
MTVKSCLDPRAAKAGGTDSRLRVASPRNSVLGTEPFIGGCKDRDFRAEYEMRAIWDSAYLPNPKYWLRDSAWDCPKRRSAMREGRISDAGWEGGNERVNRCRKEPAREINKNPDMKTELH